MTQEERKPVMNLQELELDMNDGRNGRDDPVREVMARLGDRWSALILLILATGDFRHAELKRKIGQLSSEKAISQRMLTLRLRALERNGMVRRDVSAGIPPAVSYGLTAMGLELAGELRHMIDWVKAREDKIDAARRAFDATAE